MTVTERRSRPLTIAALCFVADAGFGITMADSRLDNSNSVLLTFEPLDLYAEEEAGLEEFWLLANPALAGTTLTAQWSARSRDASGVMRDILEIEVDSAVPLIDELLTETEQPPDDAGDEEDEARTEGAGSGPRRTGG